MAIREYSFEAASSVIAGFYEAAYNEDKWQDAVDRVSRVLDCSRACIVRVQATGIAAIATVEDPDFSSQASIDAHYRDPLMHASLAAPVGWLHNRSELIDEDAFRQRELWNEWMLPRDMVDGLACNLHIADRHYWSMHLHRGVRQKAFDAEETEFVRTCVTHLMRAGEISRQLQNTTHFSALFSELPIGLLLVDRTGALQSVNRVADRLLSSPTSPLRVQHNRLTCRDTRHSAALMSLLARSLADGLPSPGGTIVVSNGEADEAQGRMVVSVAPFFGEHLFGIPMRRYAAVILRDTAMTASPEIEQHMCNLFNLSPAEARLCITLCGGAVLREAATCNGITFKTARTYLERIFVKTGTRQQSQLIALMKASRPLF